MEYLLMGFLAGSFLGMIRAWPLLREIYNPVFNGWHRVRVIVLGIVMTFGWWIGLGYLVVKYIK